MKQHIKQLLIEATNKSFNQTIPVDSIEVQATKSKGFGDFATNVALKINKVVKLPPRQVAEILLQNLTPSKEIQKVEIAGPGFINFYISNETQLGIINRIIADEFFFQQDRDESVYLEYVSSNPTGPLHVGHGRGAAYGDSIARILKAYGVKVHREYYVNDSGRQIDILTLSTWLRLLETQSSYKGKITEIYPSNAYQGDYISDIANKFTQEHAIENFIPKQLPEKSLQGIQDLEKRLDYFIGFCQSFLKDSYLLLKNFVLQDILEDIQTDLKEFRVTYDNWFSEQSLFNNQAIDKTIDELKQKNLVYTAKGALWFKAIEFGDDKDRVLVKSDKEKTYFASDISYHRHKLNSGYGLVVNIFGADHHGYTQRLTSAMQALFPRSNTLEFKIVQFATLLRGEEKVQMTTRGGKFVSLRELRQEVGTDAARFFYSMSKPEQHMNFDLQLAVERSNNNPVFYVQYAHARIYSLFKTLSERGLTWQHSPSDLKLLAQENELQLAMTLSSFSGLIQQAAEQMAPQLVNQYVRDIATQVHQYYNNSIILSDDEALRNARLSLLYCCRSVLATGLNLLGVSSPEKM